MDSDTSRTTSALLFLLSLLLHILLLLLIFLFQTDSQDAQHIEYIDLENQQPLDPSLQQQMQQQQQDPNHPEPAVKYDPDHEVLVELIAQGMEPNDTLTEQAGEIVAPTPTDIPGSFTQESAPLSEETEDEGPEGDVDEPTASDDETLAQETSETPAPSSEQPTEEPFKGAEPLEPITDTLGAQTPQPAPDQQAVTPKQAVKKIVRKLAQRPRITPAQAQALSKIAQGFMKSMNAELGGKPSDDLTQLARQRYTTKLWNCLKQTFNAERNFLILSKNVNTYLVLKITVNKQGKLIDTAFDNQKLNPELLKFGNVLLASVHKVGLFPPLPESFKKDEVTFVMPIHVRLSQGAGTISLYVDREDR